MSVLCFFDTMPFLMELKDDDIVGRGLCFVQCDFAAVIVKFAHLLIFLESFWDRFDFHSLKVAFIKVQVTAHKGGSEVAS